MVQKDGFFVWSATKNSWCFKEILLSRSVSEKAALFNILSTWFCEIGFLFRLRDLISPFWKFNWWGCCCPNFKTNLLFFSSKAFGKTPFVRGTLLMGPWKKNNHFGIKTPKVYHKVAASFSSRRDCSGTIRDATDHFEGEKKSVYFAKRLLV